MVQNTQLGEPPPPDENTVNLGTTPIARLPDDLLHDIFYTLASAGSYAIAPPDPDIVAGSILLLPASHVCRYWRSLALSSPRLWTVLHLTTSSRISMLREFLARSQGALIRVKLRGPKSVWHPSEDVIRMARILADYTQRLEELHVVQFLSEEMSKVLSFYELKPAPNLRSFSAHSGSLVEIPSLFASNMLALRSICLEKISTPWIPYEGMLELDIPNQRTPSKDDILWTLQQSSSIHTFSLIMHGDPSEPIHPRVTVDQQTPISLPNLRKLQLGTMNDTKDVLNIIPHLEFPHTASVALRLRRRHPSSTDIGELCPSIRGVAARVQHGFMQFIGYEELYNIVFRSADAALSVEWQWGAWQWGTDDEADPSSPTNTLACIALPGLQSLAIHANRYYLRADQWADVLRGVPTIDTLELDFRVGQLGCAWSKTPPLFDALGGTAGAQQGDPVCPNLRYLVIVRAGVSATQGEAWDSLVGALRARRDSGLPDLATLEVTAREQYGLAFTTVLASLERLVPKVIVRKKARRPMHVYSVR